MPTPILSRSVRFAATGVIALIATPFLYLFWLGWADKARHADGLLGLAGPTNWWQGVCFAATAGLLTAVLCWFGSPSAAAILIPVAITATWSADAVMAVAEDATFWPLGAAAVAFASVLGAVMIAVFIGTWRGNDDRAGQSSSG
jgi:hypothetical protein